MRRANIKSYTLIEVLIATAITVILMVMVFGFFNLFKLVYSSGIAQQTLQDSTNIILGKIIEGKTEPGGVYRLTEGMCPNGVCYNIANISELHYWGYPDGIERWYRLDGTSTQIIYHHPITGSPLGADEVIYTAPTGSTIALRFSIPTVANYSAAVVQMDVALTQTIFGKKISGASTTVVNIRNHP